MKQIIFILWVIPFATGMASAREKAVISQIKPLLTTLHNREADERYPLHFRSCTQEKPHWLLPVYSVDVRPRMD